MQTVLKLSDQKIEDIVNLRNRMNLSGFAPVSVGSELKPVDSLPPNVMSIPLSKKITLQVSAE